MSNRQSNIELLRIISIILIMVVHATYLTFGTPVPEEIQAKPIGSFFYIGIENISVICVDIFVLISGWFGIHPKVKSIGGLIFQCIYFGFVMFAVTIALNFQAFSLTRCAKCLIHFPHFVMCYIVMYLMTPILNAFVERASRTAFRNMLLVFFAWEFVFGWFLHSDDNFAGGNSALAFIGLYLLARYIRLHVTFAPQFRKASVWGAIWLANIFIVTLCVWACSYFDINTRLSNILLNMTTSYASPNVILASVSLLLCFSFMQFSSRILNWIAASAFASVLVHGYMMEQIYIPWIKSLYVSHPLWLFALTSAAVIFGYLLVSVIIDQPRIFIWNKIAPFIDRAFDRFRK